MASQQMINSLNIMTQIISAQELLQDAQRRAQVIIQQTPNLFPLAGDVDIDIETAIEALQDADKAAHLLFNNIQGGMS